MGNPGRSGNPGRNGDDALYLIRVYKNSTTAIAAAPTGGSYITNTKALTVPTDWLAAPAALTGTEKTYVSEASIDPNLGNSGNSFTITPTWNIPSERGGDGPAGAKGDTGDTGAAGADGEDGALGKTGAEGKMGKIGLQGPKGDTGLPGTTGPTGPQGTDGAQGVYYIRVYQNSATAPAAPTTGTYVISTKTLTVPTGWTTAPSTPPSGQKTYVTEATIDPSGATDSITPSWNTPYEAGSSGPAGAKGDKGDAGVAGAKGDKGNTGNIGTRGRQGAQGIYYIRVFQNAASAPSAPTDGSYSISTKILTLPAGWTLTPSAPSSGEKTYVTEATVNPQTPTDVFTPTWNTPYAAGSTGPAGAKGDTGDQGVFYIRVFQNAATAPSAPTDGTYVISTKTLTVPTGWTLVPSTPSSPSKTYVTEATINPATAADSSTPSWNTPYEAGSTGPAGAKGDTGDTGAAGAAGVAGAAGDAGAQGSYTVRIFTKKTGSRPATPTGGIYTLASKAIDTVPNGWASTPPTSLSSTDRIFASEFTVDPATAGATITITWGAPYQHGGKDGISGSRGVPGKQGQTGSTGPRGTAWIMKVTEPAAADAPGGALQTDDLWVNTSTTGSVCGEVEKWDGDSWEVQSPAVKLTMTCT